MIRQLLTDAVDILHDGSLPAIEYLQTSFPHSDQLMVGISTLLDPRYVFLIYAPILFALNKRIGHRFIIALTLTEWANQILKWLLAGERPYWYVHERSAQLSSQQIQGQPRVITNNAIEPIQQQQAYEFASDMNITLNVASQNQLFYLIDKNPFEALDLSDVMLNNGGDEQQMFLPESQSNPIAQLRQFPVTCELGAGSPSGHAMVTATVWFVLINAFLQSDIKAKLSQKTNNFFLTNFIASSFWTIYSAMLIAVSISRVYLACHFPHQCICGAMLGLLVGWFVCNYIPVEKLGKVHFCVATIAMFASALGTYGILGSMGFDPLWSVHKGKRWCIKPEYIHLDTTPFSSMMRYIGFCLGSGLAFEKDQIASSGLHQTTLTSILSILFGQFILSLPISSTNMILGYAISLVNYTIFSYAIAGPIPKMVSNIASRETVLHKLLKIE